MVGCCRGARARRKSAKDRRLMELHANLRAALDNLIQDTEGLRVAAGAVSERYRGRGECLQVRNDAEARAYLATRFPATYAAAWRSMQILQKALPDFAP